ncbi:GBF-interacting protein 1-like [Ziziphus jujuba]|uniref:GBF-interacting protein 1-like n=1 Tax=Ziziphus jujuba TaxID=326968 RepID=A0A6P4BDX4_ZIZJJ|nr:GBF-interacting protein 1-like [Ziziphus jujuba]
MSSGVGGSRVSIPSNVRKTIQDIREITGKQHSDDEIYAVLKECSMDPNETAQKLLYLDTFHEVKRRRDRRKENLNSKVSEERSNTGTQRRVARGGGQGNYASDVGGGKHSARKENGVNHIADRGSVSSSFPVSQKTKNNAAPQVSKTSTGMANGPTKLPNGTSEGYASKVSMGPKSSVVDANKLAASAPQPATVAASTHSSGSVEAERGKSPSKVDLLDSSTPAPVSGVYTPASDTILAPSFPGHSVSASTNVDEAGSQWVAAELNDKHGNETVSNAIDLRLSMTGTTVPGAANSIHNENTPSKSKAFEQDQISDISEPLSLPTHEVVTSESEAISVEAPESGVSNGQHVTFPNHFQVPETLKNGLTFGSFDANFQLKGDSVNVGADITGAAESSQDSGEPSNEPSTSNENASSTVQGDYPHHSQSLPHVLENLPPSEGNISSNTDSKNEQSKQDVQFPLVPQNSAVLNGPNYGLGIMSHMAGNQPVQFEGHDQQVQETRVSNLASGNSQSLSSANPALPAPSSIAMTPQSVPLFRQTYPNYFPYPFISPFYMPPPMHQFLSHNGFTPQPSTGNMFLPPAAAASAGVKFPVQQFKSGSNAGNPTHIGIQSGSSFITAPVGYAPGTAVTSGSSIGNEDLLASQLKENQIYTTGQLTEGSGVWIHAPGQDMPSLQVNSLYNLPPQGQHLTFSPGQAGHGTFPGIYQPGHAMTAPSALLQQSQAVAGAVEAIGPPSGTYQQPQHAQINWNTSF